MLWPTCEFLSKDNLSQKIVNAEESNLVDSLVTRPDIDRKILSQSCE